MHAAVCVTMALLYKDLNGLKFSLNGLWGLTKMMSGLNGLRSFSYWSKDLLLLVTHSLTHSPLISHPPADTIHLLTD